MLLCQDDIVRDVPRVRVDGRRHNVSKVVREEVGRVEAAVRGAVAPALPAEMYLAGKSPA